MDPSEFRAASRETWERVAAGWGTRRAEFNAGAAAVSAWMVDAIMPQPGHVVLELAAGPGETGLLAAELIRPGGRLISTDGAEAMVELVRERARELGLADMVQARTMEAEWIDLSTATVDSVLCRWGYMLLADPEASLRETRRVLKPGGRVALACWAPAAENALISGPSKVAIELGLAQKPDAGEPGPFSLGDPAALSELLATAGFDDIQLDSVSFATNFPTADAVFDYQCDVSPTMSALLSEVSPADHYAFREAYDDALEAFALADGTLSFPARTLVAVACA